jgi:hypothetical protein
MKCRSESVKRTVVGLSFSFFMTVNSCIKKDRPVVAQEHRGCQKTSERHLGDIALRRIFGENCVTITKVIYKLHARACLPQCKWPAPWMQGRSNLDSTTSPALLQIGNQWPVRVIHTQQLKRKLMPTLRPLRNSKASGTLFESNSTLLLS